MRCAGSVNAQTGGVVLVGNITMCGTDTFQMQLVALDFPPLMTKNLAYIPLHNNRFACSGRIILNASLVRKDGFDSNPAALPVFA